MVFHVLNRSLGRMDLFGKEADYEAFERSIEKTLASCAMRICSFPVETEDYFYSGSTEE